MRYHPSKGSTSGLINHIRKRHPEMLPEDTLNAPLAKKVSAVFSISGLNSLLFYINCIFYIADQNTTRCS